VEAEELKADSFMVASAFVQWEGEAEDGKNKGRFVQNLKPNEDWWGKGSVKLEKAAEFAAEVEKEERLISFDIKAGHRHFLLHPSIRNFFLFHYGGRYFRCIALPFGWSLAAFWFVNLLKPFVGRMRRWCYRVLS
jgi:hypothetical protein